MLLTKRYVKKGVMFWIDFKKAYDKVRWDFVREAMQKKGFPANWILQTMCTIQKGRVCININGNKTQYFKTYQWLMQGDPMSPILFNLVAKTLSTLMWKAADHGKIKGVMTHLLSEGITHIQYVDDTILMIEGDDR
jgi:hypothetical protein